MVRVFQDSTEKQKIEPELLKSAKLNWLGILAGGVVHDFNNILAGILANLQLAMIKMEKAQIFLNIWRKPLRLAVKPVKSPNNYCRSPRTVTR